MNKVIDVFNKKLNLKYENTIIIGENASAKTYILEEHINRNYKKKIDVINTFEETYEMNAYYMNVHNRKFTNNEDDFGDKKIKINETICNRLNLEMRDEDNFSMSPISEKASNYFYSIYDKEFIKNFLNGKKIKIDKRMSDGYRAIFRLLTEIKFAADNGYNTIFIDEIEKYLDNKNAYKIIQFIQNYFDEMVFYITTHSVDVVVGASDFNIIEVINDSEDVDQKSIKIYDSNDFSDDVTTKRKLFPVENNSKYSEIENRVNEIYNDLLFNDEINKDDTKYIKKIYIQNNIPDNIKIIIESIEKMRERL